MEYTETIGGAYQNVPSSNGRDYYFGSPGRKVGDFCLGFFGSFLVACLIITISTLMIYPAMLINEPGLMWVFIIIQFILPPILLSIFVILVVMSFRRGRRFIGIGMISSLFLPFILLVIALGACFVILSGSSF